MPTGYFQAVVMGMFSAELSSFWIPVSVKWHLIIVFRTNLLGLSGLYGVGMLNLGRRSTG